MNNENAPGGGHGERLSRSVELTIAALLEEPTMREAAARVGVSESTLGRWLADPHFAEAYQEARRRVLEAALARLSMVAGRAIETLVRILDSGSPNAAVRAAGLILDHAEKTAELLDLGERVRRLESAVGDDLETDDRHRGRPPQALPLRIDRLEERMPRLASGVRCGICWDVDKLAEALAAAPAAGNDFLDHCPACSAPLDDKIALEAQFTATAIQVKAKSVAA